MEKILFALSLLSIVGATIYMVYTVIKNYKDNDVSD